MPRVNIEVKPKHVHKGQCGNLENDAVALAIKEAGVKSVSVSVCTAEIGETKTPLAEPNAVSKKLPIRVKRFIQEFDRLPSSSDPTSKIERRKLAARLRLKPLTFSLRFNKKEVLQYFTPKAAKKLLAA